jgi:hypothetical protein
MPKSRGHCSLGDCTYHSDIVGAVWRYRKPPFWGKGSTCSGKTHCIHSDQRACRWTMDAIAQTTVHVRVQFPYAPPGR